jgi:hypothetical protein
MSNRSRREAASRAEARRRTRQIDRGDAPADVDSEAPSDESQARPAPAGGLLSRLFPAAPPLPDKPDPLAGFNYQGPFRSVVAGLYLLANHPRAWVPMGIAWGAAQVAAFVNLNTALGFGNVYQKVPPNYQLVDTVILILGAFAVLAAGWIGWQRPWLFGLAAVVLGTLLQATFVVLLPNVSAIAPTGVSVLFLVLTLNNLPQWLFGAFLGWYGGYLRRRMAVTQPQPQRQRRRR